MDAITKIILAAGLAVLLSIGESTASSPAPADDLHAQAVAAALDRDFADPDLNYVVLGGSGGLLAQRWEDPDKDVPIGSLIKPFLAVAYRRTHQSYPRYRCAGKKTCWVPRGHGWVGITDAIAVSCNSYFHQLVAAGGPGFTTQTLKSFGLPSEGQTPASAHASPSGLAQAYFELANEPRDQAIGPVISGLAMSSRMGTAKAVHQELPGTGTLAKTGTAPCTHAKKAPGDGFAVVIVPADHPRLLVLARVHGKPGAFAAGVAARMIGEAEGTK